MEVIQELHDAVSKACEASFDNAYRQLRSQLETQTKEAAAKHEAAVEAQRKADSTIENLRHDITLLQTELKQYEVDSQNLELPRQYASLDAEFDPKNLWGKSLEGKHFDSRKARERFEGKYTALYTNLQTFLKSWGDLKRQVRRHKQKLQQWDQQLKGDEFTLLLCGQKVRYRKVQGSGPDGLDKVDSQTNRRSLGKRPREEDPDLPAKLLKPSPKQTPRGDREVGVSAKDDYPADDSLASELASTQSSSPGPQMEHPGSSDTARPVYNCTIKQEREASSPPLPRLSDSHSQRNDPSTKRPAQIKREIMSSSPIRTSSNLGNQPYVGTQDLDDIGDTVPTPTKRKTHRDVHETNNESLEGGNHAEHSFQIPTGQKVHEQSSVLQAIDGNACAPKFAHRRSSAKRLEDLERRAIPAMAEDGENLASVRNPLHTGSGTNRGPPEAKTPGTIVQRRLDDLLERSTPTKSLLRSSKSGPGSNSKRADVIPQHDHSTSMTSGETIPDVDPDDEPYRAMPLNVLGLKHFKINPARNEGLDFAYNTVVRKRDDRKCISGCTRPGCCGDRFRAMARLGGLPGKSGVEQKQEDDEVLREFVGENTQLLVTLSDKERENLLVEARARALANQYGRHRHTHQRAQSPPGFWRTDMPSTQEEELDREAAKVLEREKVEERYREAMRPGGLWMFADE
ncbi:unnamed protein product [Penicillium salamii]|uniref:DNA endonuclease activator Ctp1 C-terminal domain-containing protein n=1 Tax=Penicillium salamii TaxID=1612424 RepID=A0A9W4NKS5_9EURO|nr:unnamed protein product [Penicillium salamii]